MQTIKHGSHGTFEHAQCFSSTAARIDKDQIRFQTNWEKSKYITRISRSEHVVDMGTDYRLGAVVHERLVIILDKNFWSAFGIKEYTVNKDNYEVGQVFLGQFSHSSL